MEQGFQYDVILSHSAKDKPVVCPVAERLRSNWLRRKVNTRLTKSVSALAVAVNLALLAPPAAGAETRCPFDESTLSFTGTPLDQAKCLLRPVMRYGRLGKPLARLPAPLEDLIGKPVALTANSLHSVQHGTWMVPAFHAAVDAGIPDAHDDPQNFDLALWAKRLDTLLHALNVSPQPPN